MNFTYKRVTTDEELNQILALQKRNSKTALLSSELLQEGFITVKHNFKLLKKMNDVCAHIIVKHNFNVVGYALTMSPRFKDEIVELKPMFNAAEELLTDKKFIAMGQICIDKPYRKMGLFKGMYAYYRKELENQYECIFTFVDTSNLRSFEAHKSVGFRMLRKHTIDRIVWVLMNWEWK